MDDLDSRERDRRRERLALLMAAAADRHWPAMPEAGRCQWRQVADLGLRIADGLPPEEIDVEMQMLSAVFLAEEEWR